MHEPHARIRSAAARADAAPTRALVIADDSAEVRARIRDALAAEFTEVVEAADGRQLVWTLLRAEVCARTGRPRLVIADLCLPGYDGLEVLEAWRAEYPDSALLLLTALPSARVHARARALQIRVLAKPFSTAALRRAVRDELGRRAG